jgi:nitrogen fixation/metabolism regulation signal transduction histidine kinase
MFSSKRKKIWIDRFQTYLVVRIAVYCVLFQAAVWALAMIDRTVGGALETFVGADAATYCYLIAFVGIAVMTISAIYDAMKFAHRLVGPLVRFRHTVRAIAAGEEIELVRLRDGDFMQDLKDDFNTMIIALEQRGAITLKAAGAKTPDAEPAAV